MWYIVFWGWLFSVGISLRFSAAAHVDNLFLFAAELCPTSCWAGWGAGGPQLSLTSHPPKDTWILWVKLWGMFVYQLLDENKSFETNTQGCNSWVIRWVSAPFGFERNCQTCRVAPVPSVRVTSCLDILTTIWWDPHTVCSGNRFLPSSFSPEEVSVRNKAPLPLNYLQ